MAVVPHKEDPNRADEIKRMHGIANGPEGKDRIKSEFGIDLGEGKGDLPKKESAPATKPEVPKTGK